jgi:hypothetical protein
MLHPYEFKWSKNRVTPGARSFQENYGTSAIEVINKDNMPNMSE